jgi:hypothetical protein
MADGNMWDELTPETQRWLQERADAMHYGNIIKAAVELLEQARERHEHYLAMDRAAEHPEPHDPWGEVDAHNHDKRVRDLRRRQG